MDLTHRQLYTVLSTSTAPWWLSMILLPRAAFTAWLVDRTPLLLGALGVSYAALLARDLGDGEGLDFNDPDAVRARLQRPDLFLAGWAHFLAFDLFVGRWIWRTALDEQRGCRLALLLTWWFGPIGLTIFMAQRRLRPVER